MLLLAGCSMGIPRLEWISPTPSSITLALILAFILIGGQIQAYAFVDGAPGIEPPPLYELLRPLSVWPAMILLLLPWILPGQVLCGLIPCGALAAVSTPALLILTYLESAWFVRSWRLSGGLARGLSVVASLLPGLPSLPQVPMDPIFFLSSFILTSLVAAVHIVSAYGLMRALRRGPGLSREGGSA